MKLVNHYMNIVEKKVMRDCNKIKKNMGIVPDIIFDIGANVGMYSLFFAQIWPNAAIYAFEPVKDTYDVLVKNIELNNFSNIKVFNYGIYVDNIILDMGIPVDRESENIGLYTLKRKVKLKDIVSCEFRKISDVIYNLGIRNIDLMKIDVEGSEFDILSSKNVLDIIRYIHIEFNDFFEETSNLTGLLFDNNFKYIKTTRKQNQLWINMKKDNND